MAFVVEKKIDIGNILTVLTIGLSVLTFSLAWKKEADSRRAERANVVRSAAAKTLVKLDRWRGVSLSMFEQIKPDYVDTKLQLLKLYDVNVARDKLWKAMYGTRVHMLRRASDEQVEMAYLDLYAFMPEIREVFNQTLSQLKDDEQLVFGAVMQGTQAVVRGWRDCRPKFTTARVWQDLVETSDTKGQVYQAHLDTTLLPLNEALNELIKMPDEDILDPSKLRQLAAKATASWNSRPKTAMKFPDLEGCESWKTL